MARQPRRKVEELVPDWIGRHEIEQAGGEQRDWSRTVGGLALALELNAKKNSNLNFKYPARIRACEPEWTVIQEFFRREFGAKTKSETLERLVGFLQARLGISRNQALELGLPEAVEVLRGKHPEDHGLLTDSQQAVYEAIRDHAPIQANDICILAGVKLSNFKSHILPALKLKLSPRKITNQRGAG